MREVVAAEKGEDTDDVPDEQPTFFYPIDYVIRTWIEHRMHHTYPEMGGYGDQCEFLMRDWHTLSMYYLRVSKGVFTAIPISPNAPNWHTLMGG